MSPEANASPTEIFSEEDLIQLSFLRDEEVDELVSKGHLSEDTRLHSPLDSALQFPHPEMILHIQPGQVYPVLTETKDLFNLKTYPFPDLHSICDDALQTNTFSVWNTREELNPYGLFDRTMLVLSLADETRRHIEEYRRVLLSKAPKPIEGPATKAPSTVLSASEMARDLLGKPEDVVAKIPPYWRVMHVEEILRRNLAEKFYAARDSLRHTLEAVSISSLQKFRPRAERGRGGHQEDIIDHLTTPVLTFHGTPRTTVPSIVRHGFLVPGSRLPGTSKWKDDDGEGTLQVRCGSTYGRGIYSSPSAAFSLSYSGSQCEPTPPNKYFGLKLIACATLMGRTVQMTRGDQWWTRSEPVPGADSHVGNNMHEYIVFSPARIIPVYVVHLDWGTANAEHLCIPKDPTQWSSQANARAWGGVNASRGVSSSSGAPVAGDRQKQKAAIMARARKWFPYGFGPLSGKNFVVEDVGYVSEDEEDYGEYQRGRNDGEQHNAAIEYWSWFKETTNEERKKYAEENPQDEYTEEKLAAACKGMSEEDWKRLPNPEELNRPVDDLLKDDEEFDLGIALMMNRTEEVN